MFRSSSDDGYRELLPGIRIKTLVHGKETLMAEFLMQQGASLPRHSHPHEQTGYLVEGKLRLNVEGETRDLAAGDSWSIPGDAFHSAEVLEESRALEIFSPLREDYLRFFDLKPG